MFDFILKFRNSQLPDGCDYPSKLYDLTQEAVSSAGVLTHHVVSKKGNIAITPIFEIKFYFIYAFLF